MMSPSTRPTFSYEVNQMKTETKTPSMTASECAYVQGLRDVADFLEQNPNFISCIDFNCLSSSGRHGVSPTVMAELLDATVRFDESGAIRVKKMFGPHSVEVFWKADKETMDRAIRIAHGMEDSK